MSSQINQIVAGTYPGGDTSTTAQFRSIDNSTYNLVDNTETLIAAATTVDPGNINIIALSTTVIKYINACTVGGTLVLNVHTTGAAVTFNVWFEYSLDNGNTWAIYPNSFKQILIATDATFDIGSTLFGAVPAGTQFRLKCRRNGGTTCTLSANTITVAAGTTTQPSVLLRLYGI